MPTTHIAPTTPIIAIRPATADDAADLRRLAALDSAPTPTGDLLVGVVDGEIRAAVPVAGGRAVADPFVPSGEVVSLLEIRAARLREDAPPTARRPAAVAAARRMRRATALRT